MNLELQGKSVLVTGGSRGIGYACCEMFAAEGCNVTILGSQRQSVEGASARLEAQTGRRVRRGRGCRLNNGLQSGALSPLISRTFAFDEMDDR